MMAYTRKPGSNNFSVISHRVVTSSSSGAWITIMVLPSKLSTQPIFPSRFIDSPSRWEDRTALIRTLRAPSGVTTVAGANMYAAKLATSPAPIVRSPPHQTQSFRYPCPPSPALVCPLVARRSNAFFFRITLPPIKKAESTARIRPIQKL